MKKYRKWMLALGTLFLSLQMACGTAVPEEGDFTASAVTDTAETAVQTELSQEELSQEEFLEGQLQEPSVTEDGNYTQKDEVALYLHLYEHLPDNYITKKEAKALGWDSSAGNLWEVAPGKSIGGDHFGNYEELLPEEDGRDYFECDIDYEGGYRNAKRIIYSDDGLIFYTEDHYQTFEQLYGK